MTRIAVPITFSLLLSAGLAFPNVKKAPTKFASGTVKAVSADSLTVMQGAQELRFVVDKETLVLAKGASHKTQAASAQGKSTAITDIVKENQSVTVKYHDTEGKLHATEVRVR